MQTERTTDDKIAAGWVEVEPGRWSIPPADPRELRTAENGYTYERPTTRGTITDAGDGTFALVKSHAIRGSVGTGLGLDSRPMGKRSIILDPERRAEWRAERVVANRIRAAAISARRRAAILATVVEWLDEEHADATSRAYVRPARQGARLAYNRRLPEGEPRLALGRIPVASIVAELTAEAVDLASRAAILSRLAHTTDERIRRIYSPVRRASRRASQAKYHANLTPEQRDACRAKGAARAAAYRARRKAAAAAK